MSHNTQIKWDLETEQLSPLISKLAGSPLRISGGSHETIFLDLFTFAMS
jgi:hypothetical protein